MHTNRLALEKSPYLLQHQHNPVDWYAWSEEAFAKARQQNKPIFLSIGYSTCHWCHVMERESFENKQVADFLNAYFVSIKVDREERPDVDKIYMTAVQAMTGEGGWPLNCFLTPELKPFFGGTYFPLKDKYGRVSFLYLLQQIAHLWETQRHEILNSAESLHSKLLAFTSHEQTSFPLSSDLLKHAALQFKQGYDTKNGGFGDAPKFPRPSVPLFLLRYGTRVKDDQAVKMVLHTCDQMAAGGIYDQLGGGFARYSVDARWLVPHFEKMLYDNAQLVNLYLDAYLISGQKQYADIARDVIEYILRDLTDPQGGFYSAEDADSEGKEGKFYCWTIAELKQLLFPSEFKVVTRYFDITDQGNFIDHSDPNPLLNQNILSIVNSDLSEDEGRLLSTAKEKMFQARNKRVRPHLDDKILTSWNGLMLSAIARASIVLNDKRYCAVAEKNLAFLKEKLWDADLKIIYHRWRDSEHDHVQLLDAYAYLLCGVLDLYEATLEPGHLNFALDLANTMLAKFYDATEGGFFESDADTADLILRTKEDYDGPEPSGNSVALICLLRLHAITGKQSFKDAAENTLQHFSARIQQLPQAVPHMLLALDYLLYEPKRVVLTGADPSLLQTVHSVYQPNKVVFSSDGPVDEFAKSLCLKNAPMVFICTGNACLPPTKNIEEIKQTLLLND